jgi:sulfofructose kinase
MPEVEVICVGGAKCDLNAAIDEFPQPDQRILIDHLQDAIGGQAITAAVAIARLGVPVGYCGVIGRDAAGDRIMQRLEEEGISTQWVDRRAGISTSRSMNIVAGRTLTRAIITEQALSPEAATVEALQAPWVHFDDVGFPSSAALRKHRSKGVRFSIDGGNPIQGLDLHGIDIYAPTITRLGDQFGANLSPRALLQMAVNQGAQAVVATDGATGCYILGNGVFQLVPGFDVAVVSTLGAGDVFHGALLAGICLGKSLPEAVRWGNAAAALSCRALDGQSMTPRRTELEAFLATHAEHVSD